MDVVARAFEADIEVLDPLKKDILRNLDEISRKLESGFSVKPDTVKINQEQEE